MLFETLDAQDPRRHIPNGLFLLIELQVVVVIEILEDKRRPILPVPDVLLDVLYLLYQEELILLCQVIEVDFVGKVNNIINEALGRRFIILFFLKVVDLVG